MVFFVGVFSASCEEISPAGRQMTGSGSEESEEAGDKLETCVKTSTLDGSPRLVLHQVSFTGTAFP